MRWMLVAALALFAGPPMDAHAQISDGPAALTYGERTRGPVPIPPAERGLQTVVAEPWFKVSDEALSLEGPSFDRDGDLLFGSAKDGRVFRLGQDRKLSTLVGPNDLGLGGLAVHRDGRIFAAGAGDFRGGGSIVSR